MADGWGKLASGEMKGMARTVDWCHRGVHVGQQLKTRIKRPGVAKEKEQRVVNRRWNRVGKYSHAKQRSALM